MTPALTEVNDACEHLSRTIKAGKPTMHECPHCHQDGISSMQKILAVSFIHATCRYCGQQSYIHVLYGLMALTAWIVITWIFIGLAYFFRMSFLLLATIPAMVIAVDKFLLHAPLFRVR